MKRGAFLTAGAACALVPSRAHARPLADVSETVARIPGLTGIYARTMDGSPPFLEVHPDTSFASASIIKLAIMAHVYRAYDAGTAKPADTVAVRAEDLIGGSDVLAGTAPGTRWSLDALVRAMIRYSDNSASNALISTFGFEAINATARQAGMTGTRLARHFADVVPSWRRSLNATTPHDIGTLLYTIERGAREGIDTIARATSCRAMIDILLGQTDRDKIPAGLPRGTPVANKTGEIDGVRNDGAIVDPFGDVPYVLVVLTAGLRDTSAGRAGIAAIARRVDAAVRGAA